MKQVYIIDDYASSKTNGIGSYIRELTYCLKEAGCKVSLVVCNYETDTFQIVHEENVIRMLIPRMPGYVMENYKAILPLLRLYINDSEDNLFIVNHSPCEAFLKALKKLFPASKLVFVIHDMGWTFQLLGDTTQFKDIIRTKDQKEIQKKYKGLIDYFLEEQRMYGIVDKVIVLAKETEALLTDIYDVDMSKLFFSLNGSRDTYKFYDESEKAVLRRKLYLDEQEKIILYTGRNTQIKGSYQLLHCFEKVLQYEANCRLVIVGTLFESYKLLKQSSEVAAKVSFTGQIAPEKVQDWYKVADIGVLPSYFEQCSYTGIEMMMHSLPIVASDGFCLGNMFTDNENAKIAKIEDRTNSEIFENNLVNAIVELLKSEEICKKLSHNARKKYESCHTIKDMKNNYNLLLDSL
jgi:glycosyltransferase